MTTNADSRGAHGPNHVFPNLNGHGPNGNHVHNNGDTTDNNELALARSLPEVGRPQQEEGMVRKRLEPVRKLVLAQPPLAPAPGD